MERAVPRTNLARRAANKWRRATIGRFARRPFPLASDVAYISFTFDDFPRSAYTEGGRILQDGGVRGTFFLSFQLIDRPSPSGQIVSLDEVRDLVRQGHELGCHTFEHLNGRNSTVEAFVRSIEQNRAAVTQHVPGADMRTFAYPLDGPVLRIKRAVGRHFIGCRGGGQTFNSGELDLNLLSAYFIDYRNNRDLKTIRDVIRRNVEARGWLIFATHDVATPPSKYGCTPTFFDEVVRVACASGATVLPMSDVCRALHIAA